MGKARYRILTADGRIKYAGTNYPSWLNLESARLKVDYSKGEMIYEYDREHNALWEIF